MYGILSVALVVDLIFFGYSFWLFLLVIPFGYLFWLFVLVGARLRQIWFIGNIIIPKPGNNFSRF
jgi:hypothetical protein